MDSVPPSADYAALSAFLESPARPAGTFRFEELRGFLFAIASAPELVPPSDWMPEVFDGLEANYVSLDEARAIIGQMLALYNVVNDMVGTVQDEAHEEDWVFRVDVLSNLEEGAPVQLWSRGFVRGHTWLQDVWDTCLPEEMDDEFGSILLVLSFFASRNIAERFLAESATEGASLETMAGTMRTLFPMAVAEYAQLGRSIHQVLMEEEVERHTPVRRSKVGRNDSCTCGSGKKFKKCCGAVAG